VATPPLALPGLAHATRWCGALLAPLRLILWLHGSSGKIGFLQYFLGFELWSEDNSGEGVKWRVERSVEGQGDPTPCHSATWPWPRHHVVWWHGGSPEVSQVSLCPTFDIKI
jgi:hypothetical protein